MKHRQPFVKTAKWTLLAATLLVAGLWAASCYGRFETVVQVSSHEVSLTTVPGAWMIQIYDVGAPVSLSSQRSGEREPISARRDIDAMLRQNSRDTWSMILRGLASELPWGVWKPDLRTYRASNRQGFPSHAFLVLPLWMPLAAAGLPAALLLWLDRRSRRWAREGACTKCGYLRAGLATGAACPECGRKAERSAVRT